jgi:hypothetical protein
MTDEEINALTKVKLVFKFMTFGKGNKPVYVWMDENGNDRVYSDKGRNLVAASPGMTFEFPEIKGSDSILSGRRHYVGRHKDEQEVTEWAAIDRANKGRYEALKREERAAKDDPLMKHIKPLALAYQELNHPQRVQFLAWLNAKITGYKE